MLSVFLCFMICLSFVPASAFAEGEHVHDSECGYVEAVAGSPCTHECGEDCSPCTHEHDAECGYTAAVEGAPCTYAEQEENKAEEEQPAESKPVEEQPTENKPEVEQPKDETPKADEAVAEVQAKVDNLPAVETVASMSTEQKSVLSEKLDALCDDYYDGLSEAQQAQVTGFDKVGELYDALGAYEPSLLEAQRIYDSDTYWEFDEATGTLTISGTGGMPYIPDEDFQPWASVRSSITSVVIEAGVTVVGRFAFACAENLSTVTIPESVTEISTSAFESCTGLTSVTIPKSVTTINDSAFNGCTGLTSVTIPGSVGTIGLYSFRNCSNLKDVTISEGVKTIANYAFSETGLTSIVIPKSVELIGLYAFENCSRLTDVTISEGVNTIDNYAFSGTGLTSVTIPKSVTRIGFRAFADSKRLSTVTVLSENPPELGNYAFRSVSNMLKIYVPEGTAETYKTAWAAYADKIVEFVPVSVTGVTLDKTTAFMNVGGKTLTLAAAVLPNNATDKNVTWSSSNPAAATVSASGVVTAVAVGNTTITVTTEDGGFTASCEVKVKEPIPDWVPEIIAKVDAVASSLYADTDSGSKTLAEVYTSLGAFVDSLSDIDYTKYYEEGTAVYLFEGKLGEEDAQALVKLDAEENAAYVNIHSGTVDYRFRYFERNLQVFKTVDGQEVPAEDGVDFQWLDDQLALLTNDLTVTSGSSTALSKAGLSIGYGPQPISTVAFRNLYMKQPAFFDTNCAVTLVGTNQIGPSDQSVQCGIVLENGISLIVTGGGSLTIYDRENGIRSDNANVSFGYGFTGTVTVHDSGANKAAIDIGSGTLTAASGTLNLTSEQGTAIIAEKIAINGGAVTAQGGVQAMSTAPTLDKGVTFGAGDDAEHITAAGGSSKAGEVPGKKYFTTPYEVPHTHVWSADWTRIDTAHWHECTAVDCPITDYSTCGEAGAAYGEHDYDARGLCVCGDKILVFLDVAPELAGKWILKNDKNYYEITYDASSDTAVFSYHWVNDSGVETDYEDYTSDIKKTEKDNDRIILDYFDAEFDQGKGMSFHQVYEGNTLTETDGTGCTAVYERQVPAHTHIWSAEWSHNDTAHWHECTAEGCSITDYSTCGEEGAAYGAHSYNAMYTCICGEKKPVSYVYYENGEWQNGTPEDYEIISEDTTRFEDGKWYVYPGPSQKKGEPGVNPPSGTVTVSGTANLILIDGKGLDLSYNGLVVPESSTLNIYGQSEGSGSLTVHGADGAAGIGGSSGSSCGTVNIHGGDITAEGNYYGAGIGGGRYGNGGNITIYGGSVTAKGAYNSAGIGGGDGGKGGKVTIYDGTVKATGSLTGSSGGPGIGGSQGKDQGTLTLGTGVTFGAGKDADNITEWKNLENARTMSYFQSPFTAPAHTHSFSFSASQNKAIATCANTDGACQLDEDGKHTVTLTLTANNSTYTGSAYNGASTDDATVKFTETTGASLGEIQYFNDGTALTAAPVNSGSYTAKVTVTKGESSATAEAAFTIAKAAATITTNPTAAAITYGQTLADSTLTGGTTSVPGSFAWENGTTVPAVSDSGTTLYNVKFTPTDASNYTEVTVQITLTVNKTEYTDAVKTATGTLPAKSGKTVEITLPAVPTGAAYGEVTNGNTDFFTVSAIADGKVTVTSAKNWDSQTETADKTFTVAVTPDANHNGYNITVTVKPAFHNHSWSGEWTHNETGHWHACTAADCNITDYSACGESGAAYAAHSFNGNICSVCGYVKGGVYTIIEGANSEWMKGSTSGMLIASDAPFSKFTGVKVDGNAVAGSNYTAVEGSTRVTFKPAYLETLSVGKHAVDIVSSDGTASTEFMIKSSVVPPVHYTVYFNMRGHGQQVASQIVEAGGKTVRPSDPRASGWTFAGWYADADCTVGFNFNTPINADTVVYAKWIPYSPFNPKTGDTANLILWAFLLAGSAIGIASAGIFTKKKKH